VIVAAPIKAGHFILFQQMGDAAIQLFCDGARPRHNRIKIIVYPLCRQPKFFGPLHQMIYLRGAQHRLRGNATPIETNAAHMLAFDHNGFSNPIVLHELPQRSPLAPLQSRSHHRNCQPFQDSTFELV
jgi:hypothetical protein